MSGLMVSLAIGISQRAFSYEAKETTRLGSSVRRLTQDRHKKGELLKSRYRGAGWYAEQLDDRITHAAE
jgi:hypothetical protein